MVECGSVQGIFMLVAGFFRLINDLPKPVWRYPLSYIGFDMYALQVRALVAVPNLVQNESPRVDIWICGTLTFPNVNLR